MSFEPPHKKEFPSPIARAVDSGAAPRPVSPLKRFAIPAGIVMGLTLVGAGLALELSLRSNDGDSCERAGNDDNVIVKLLKHSPLQWLLPAEKSRTPGGEEGVMLPAPPSTVAAAPPQEPEHNTIAVAGGTGSPAQPQPPPPPPIAPTVHYPRPSGAVATPPHPGPPVQRPPMLGGKPVPPRPPQ
jgi:hypothetical protein